MHRLPVGGRHRLQRLRLTGLDDLGGDRPCELLEGGAALLPVAADIDPEPGVVIAEPALNVRLRVAPPEPETP